MTIDIRRLKVTLKSDLKRVLLRPFNPTTEMRSRKIIQRVLSLSSKEVEDEYNQILNEFENRHRNIASFFLKRFKDNQKFVERNQVLTETQKCLIGAYFSLEYSLEAASLFNPSMVWHPDQSNLSIGSRRFILSLRATGEGHISSIEFRSGVISPEYTITLDKISPYVMSAINQPLDGLYIAKFPEEFPLSERVLFPFLPEECNGMEDARFVYFTDQDGNSTYYATYTAYDGKQIYSMLLQTSDFLKFSIKKLHGKEVRNKGLALFPRQIAGKFVMLSRQDNENNYIMFSDRIDHWNDKIPLMEPKFSWEFFQIGNCGCPLETSEGWLVLAHGVGALRKYVISAFLLDKNDPTRVLGRLNYPLMMASSEEREGYVPNVVYTCGGQLFNDSLVFPYAMSDYACGFAKVDLTSLLNALT